MKEKVITALISKGYSRATALELIAKYIDVYEVNEDILKPAELADELIEQQNQED